MVDKKGLNASLPLPAQWIGVAALLLTLTWPGPARADVEPLSGWTAEDRGPDTLFTPRFHRQWLVRRAQWQDTQLTHGPDEPITRSALQLTYADRSPERAYHLEYEYQPIRIRTGQPAHNGHLHQFDGRWRHAGEHGQVEVGGGVHATSNMFRYGRFHRDALVLRFGLLHDSPLTLFDQIGLAGDYRFGPFRLYPRVTRRIDLGAKGRLSIDLPRALSWHTDNGYWQVSLERYGNKWGALDRDRELKSAIHLQEWRLTSRHRHPLGTKLFLDLEVGVSFDSRIRYTDLARGRQTQRLDSNAFGALTLGGWW